MTPLARLFDLSPLRLSDSPTLLLRLQAALGGPDSVCMAPKVVESSVLSPLSVTEKLLVAQAVYQVGTGDYKSVAKVLLGHPLLELANRPPAFFSSEVSLLDPAPSPQKRP